MTGGRSDKGRCTKGEAKKRLAFMRKCIAAGLSWSTIKIRFANEFNCSARNADRYRTRACIQIREEAGLTKEQVIAETIEQLDACAREAWRKRPIVGKSGKVVGHRRDHIGRAKILLDRAKMLGAGPGSNKHETTVNVQMNVLANAPSDQRGSRLAAIAQRLGAREVAAAIVGGQGVSGLEAIGNPQDADRTGNGELVRIRKTGVAPD